jgi:hypothetical protein
VIKQSIRPIIGRWTVDYNINRINRKVDLSNEDHCGTCTSTPEITATEKINLFIFTNYLTIILQTIKKY